MAQPVRLAVSETAGSALELFAEFLFHKLGIGVIVISRKGSAESSNAPLAGDVPALQVTRPRRARPADDAGGAQSVERGRAGGAL